MPAKSQAQRRWAFAVMGEKWARAHHFDVLSTAREARKTKGHVQKKK